MHWWMILGAVGYVFFYGKLDEESIDLGVRDDVVMGENTAFYSEYSDRVP
ncbi:hypothetical protein ABUL39_04745 [Rhodothermus marinus]